MAVPTGTACRVTLGPGMDTDEGMAFDVFLALVLGGLALFATLLVGIVVSLWRREHRGDTR